MQVFSTLFLANLLIIPTSSVCQSVVLGSRDTWILGIVMSALADTNYYIADLLTDRDTRGCLKIDTGLKVYPSFLTFKISPPPNNTLLSVVIE